MDALNSFYLFASILQVFDISVRLLWRVARRLEAHHRNPEDNRLIPYGVR
jgi:hypothetical protein